MQEFQAAFHVSCPISTSKCPKKNKNLTHWDSYIPLIPIMTQRFGTHDSSGDPDDNASNHGSIPPLVNDDSDIEVVAKENSGTCRNETWWCLCRYRCRLFCRRLELGCSSLRCSGRHPKQFPLISRRRRSGFKVTMRYQSGSHRIATLSQGRNATRRNFASKS